MASSLIFSILFKKRAFSQLLAKKLQNFQNIFQKYFWKLLYSTLL